MLPQAGSNQSLSKRGMSVALISTLLKAKPGSRELMT